MKLLEKILVPIKFETINDKIILVASDFAKKYNSEIILLHVLPKEAMAASIKNLVEKAALDSLKDIKAQIMANQHCHIKELIDYGSPFDSIINTAEKEDVNLILMGAGPGGEGLQYPLDITTQKVMRKTDKPVWVVKYDQVNIFERILCPVDFSGASERALNNAIQIAHKYEVKLEILSVYEPIDIQSPRLEIDLDKENEIYKREFEKEFDSFISKFNLADVETNKVLLTGDPATEILNYIKQKNTSLLLLGTTGKSGLTRILMGSVAEKVTREVPSSFITTKSEDILNLKLEKEVTDIEKHFNQAEELYENRMWVEAKKQYLICLKINDLHIPAYMGLAKVYEKLNDKFQSEKYRSIGQSLWQKIYNQKIEMEIKKSFRM